MSDYGTGLYLLRTTRLPVRPQSLAPNRNRSKRIGDPRRTARLFPRPRHRSDVHMTENSGIEVSGS